MIISVSHFEPQFQAINSLLLTENEQPQTTFFRHKNEDYPFTPEELNEWYLNNLGSFPLQTQAAGDTVSIDNRFGNYYRKYHKMDSVVEMQTELRKELDGMDRDGVLLDVEEYIREWVNNIFIDFAQAMALVKKEPAFGCVHDDLIVMKNLLTYYVSIRNSKNEQLQFFSNTFIPKTVADQMADVLIILLTDRIKMIEPDYSFQAASIKSATITTNYKISWLASQQEFGELINELTNKGYISFPDTALSMQASHLTRIFDFSVSKRKADANIANNILKVLQPIFDQDNKVGTYSYQKPGYVPKFDSIPSYISKRKK